VNALGDKEYKKLKAFFALVHISKILCMAGEAANASGLYSRRPLSGLDQRLQTPSYFSHPLLKIKT